MFKPKQLAAALMLAGALTATGCSAAADSSAPPADLKAKLSKSIGREVTAVNKTPIKGIFEVIIDKREILYSDAKGEYILQGDLVNVAKRTSITREREAELSVTDFSKLPLADAVKEVRGDGSRKLVVFSDPDCPFCKRLEQQSLAQTDNVTIYTFLFPLSIHPDAERKSRLIWCAEDRAAAWKDFMFKDKLAENKGECENPVARNLKLGESLGITGTPALIFENGRMVAGAVPADVIERLLNEAKAEVASKKK
ncbi:DsbC family protein [Chitinilyticum litopenaei]|uniref:DsbC family protein n=1 Tax=Chitinilyticum litopenaei TaxID=1121276 RepID=UPI00048B8F4E|nr:DsbC family protein [Chitinilyticum litopenaei]